MWTNPGRNCWRCFEAGTCCILSIPRHEDDEDHRSSHTRINKIFGQDFMTDKILVERFKLADRYLAISLSTDYRHPEQLFHCRECNVVGFVVQPKQWNIVLAQRPVNVSRARTHTLWLTMNEFTRYVWKHCSNSGGDWHAPLCVFVWKGVAYSVLCNILRVYMFC